MTPRGIYTRPKEKPPEEKRPPIIDETPNPEVPYTPSRLFGTDVPQPRAPVAETPRVTRVQCPHCLSDWVVPRHYIENGETKTDWSAVYCLVCDTGYNIPKGDFEKYGRRERRG